ncbi:hypothetical protein XM38_017400 [Halomicronema hongdechloris C2206]|uniref:Uncharacterized protein n=1 Tax=Halomicronema hongdechloris C2206 TaxID=1641165 RepID=A0A1Z3HKH5_9CYAN|nr:hypothetical protein XM38_017400 [Halomicronema hongdechloris C2206]
MSETVYDEILEEIYRIREEHAKVFNYDLKAIAITVEFRTASHRL